MKDMYWDRKLIPAVGDSQDFLLGCWWEIDRIWYG